MVTKGVVWLAALALAASACGKKSDDKQEGAEKVVEPSQPAPEAPKPGPEPKSAVPAPADVPALAEGVPLSGAWDDEHPTAAQWNTEGKAIMFELEQQEGSESVALTATVDGAKTKLLDFEVNFARGGQLAWLLRGDRVLFTYTSGAASQDEGDAAAVLYKWEGGKVVQDKTWSGTELDDPPGWAELPASPE